MKLDRILPMLLATEEGCRLGQVCIGLGGLFVFSALIALFISWWSDVHVAVAYPAAQNVALLDEELFRAIPQAHLFGYYPPTSSAAIPITSLPLRLAGIINVGDSSESKVLISVEGGIGKVYQEGDMLPNGIKLTAILPDGVLLDNGGHTERLPFVRPKLERTL